MVKRICRWIYCI